MKQWKHWKQWTSILLPLLMWLGGSMQVAYGQGIYGNRVIEGTVNYCADAGITDDYACSLSPAISAYTTGACYVFKANTANTGAATINLNGLGAKTIVKVTSTVATTLANSDIRAGQLVKVCYDGTNMQMSSMLGNTATADPDTVTSAATLTSGVPMIGNGSKSITTGTRGGNTTEFATISGTKTTNKQLAFDASGNIIASATDIGGSGSGEVASTSYILYNGLMQGATQASQVTGSANQGLCNLIHVPHKASWTQAAFKVTTQSGTCGGTCGFQIGVYSMPGRSVLAKTEAGTSGNGTSTKDINTTGWKFLNWSSGSQVSAGTLTLDAGSYLTCYTTDSTAIYISMKYQPAYLYTENEYSTAKHSFNVHGYQAGFSSGSGGSIALPASWSGNLTAAGSGENHAQIFFVP